MSMLQEFKITAYATSDKPKDATAELWIPENGRYHSHRVVVWTQNAEGRIVGQGVDRLPISGRVSRVWVQLHAPGKSWWGPRNWIGVELYVTVDIAVTETPKAA
jgi:hypothetical protein